MLEIDSICKSYNGRQVLAPVSFRVGPGECVGVAGENGSGKSTLLRLLAQVERPDRGDIRYDGASVLGDRKFLRRHMGYVPQHHDLMEDLTVSAQLKLWQSACGQSGPISAEIMELLGIEPMLRSRIGTLSGGMQRRVSIAMALLGSPDILVMDEATAGLDRGYSEELLNWLERYLRRGGRLIWCSHSPEELSRLCGSCLRIRDGQIMM